MSPIEELFKTMNDATKSAKSEGASANAMTAQAMGAGMGYLLKRIEMLEKNPMQYMGTHDQDKAYQRGMFVTHNGSLWHCNSVTRGRPGDDPAWSLAVKKGRDGR